MDGQQPGYQSYVLRLWQERPHQTWRVMVQVVPAGKWQAFTNLEGLFVYLARQTAVGPEPGQDQSS
jgi:hypothetical protein